MLDLESSTDPLADTEQPRAAATASDAEAQDTQAAQRCRLMSSRGG
jgi:hypothetical protein